MSPPSRATVGERLHAPVVLVAAAVEDDRVDARALGALREQLPDLLGLV